MLSLTATHVAAQVTDFQLRRFGSQPVSDAEVAQIATLVVSTGKRPWLVRSPHSWMPDVQIASLFLEPDAPSPRVQRGRMLSLVAEGPRFAPARTPWRIRESSVYAYIPVSGRPLGEVLDENDVSWPFVVQGEFDDDTLISVVEFIRSQPPVPVPAFLRSVPAAPIAGIQRLDDAIVVGLRTSEATSSSVWLVRNDGQWVITRSDSAIV